MSTVPPQAPSTAPPPPVRRRGGSAGSSANYSRMVSTYRVPPAGATTGARFTAEGALNKTGLLGLLAVTVGAVAAVADVPLGLAVVGMLVALGLGIWCSLSPRRAPVLAPIYAVLEGGVLGVISRYYADQGLHVVALAIIGTLAIVAGVWTLYRTGLVRVGTRAATRRLLLERRPPATRFGT